MGRLADAVARVERRLPLALKTGVPVLVAGLVPATLTSRAATATLGTALLLLVLWGPLAVLVLHRVRRLTGVVAKVSSGDLTARAPGSDEPARDHLLRAATGLNRMLDTLEESRHQVRSVLEGAQDAYVGMGCDGLVDDWNDAAERLFGWSRAEAVGQVLAELIVPPSLRDAHNAGVRGYRLTGHAPVVGRTIEILALHRAGHQFPAELTVWESWASGTRRFNAFIRDTTERKRLENELTHRALHDSLTGLSNRTLFGDRLEHALSRRGTGQLAVLLLDLDDFKAVNESLGHSAGDQLLVAVSIRLGAVLRPSDSLARLAGDEFALLAENLAGVTEAEQIAARLLGVLRAPFQVGGRELFVHASIGIALDTIERDRIGRDPIGQERIGRERIGRDSGPGDDAEGLLRNAGVAMYAAKRGNASRYAVFEPRMHEAAVHRLELKADLERALRRDELRVHYQPYVELSSGEVIGFEALVRWEHPGRGLLLPVSFMPLAEETGLVRAIDRWVLAEAARQAAWWAAHRPESGPLTISVNVSPRDLQDPGFVDEVTAVLARTKVLPSTLVLEVTESTLNADVGVAAERLGRLSELGVRVAVDDFGTACSLAHLASFPVDTFKIDKSFVDSIVTDPESPIAEAIAMIGRTMRLQTVAEGVESRAQLDRLRALGCHVAQGFLFAEPLPPEAATALLTPRPGPRVEPSGGSGGHLALPV